MAGLIKQWTLFLAANLGLAGYFGYALLSPAANIKTILLPGKTTHGHYQIELACNACHSETGDMEFMENACVNCHGEDLKKSRDTHPAKKFSDPVHAATLEILDATKCVTCHQEHVEERTLEMGLTMPADYCYHCHQETLGNRPSHTALAFDSCGNAGCHNYHDNRALYERFLSRHTDEPDHLTRIKTLKREPIDFKEGVSFTADQADGVTDAPTGTDTHIRGGQPILDDWATTAHALAGVNCSGCHVVSLSDDVETEWSDAVPHQVCATCHQSQAEGFLRGRHGMRLGSDLPPMTPGDARLEMHTSASHRSLDCSACHAGHRFDTKFAAVDACLQCHNDSHSNAFKDSSHFALFEAEQAGEAKPGTGVTCATCHMPRVEDDDDNVVVQHNQNNNLRPNEKMLREVCMDCHGMQFSMNALADTQLIDQCFASTPSIHVESIDMAKAWFELQEQKRLERKRKRDEARKRKQEQKAAQS